MKIWHLNFELDEFDNLKFKKDIDIDEIQSYDGRQKLIEWTPLEVVKMEDKLLSNAPGFYSHLPVFDKKVLDVVGDLINDDVEILPLNCEHGNYFAINVVSVLDCINYEKSIYKTFRDGKRIMRFVRYEFISEKVIENHIFKIIDEPTRRPFVSDKFRQRILDSGLVGFKFELVWNSEDS